ncbi:MAG TPA: glycosyltransferase family 4 protein, partial [Bryobacteraceae bacterium]|nr:glycosyltransferase family 4 protein [Bryobacteraceae bacterium]
MNRGQVLKSTRVLMTADTLGGVWTYCLELARALGPQGIEVGLATMGRRLSREQRQEAGSLRNLEIFESDFKLEWMENPWRDVANSGAWLLELESRFKPGLIHLNGYAHAALPWKAPTVVVAHSCVLSWWRAVYKEEAPAEWNQYREAVRAGVQAADLLVAPSQAMLDSLGEHYGPLPASRVVPNGRALPWLTPRPKEKLILAVGRLWDEAKNIDALAAIASDLHWPVYVAGEVQKPGGSSLHFKGIHCLGHMSGTKLLSWFERASIYALPARYEPFGLSVLEAAITGCGLVLGDIPTLRELWEPAALFVPPDEPETLRHALRELISSPAW